MTSLQGSLGRTGLVKPIVPSAMASGVGLGGAATFAAVSALEGDALATAPPLGMGGAAALALPMLGFNTAPLDFSPVTMISDGSTPMSSSPLASSLASSLIDPAAVERSKVSSHTVGRMLVKGKCPSASGVPSTSLS